ncbi:MAG TPA: glycosyltransferase family 39 protein, partial [Candidatus Hydrogenedentes bacterium]|nr:glycosyltransferase family 39 protein [Candidatus Hydrogenedentota bacterium]
SRREWLALAAILLLGLLLRVWYLDVILDAPDFAAPQQDPDVQDYYARALISGDWSVREGCNDPHMRTTPYFRPPGHGYLLAAIYWLANGNYLAPRLFNLALGLASIWLVYRLGKRVYGAKEGLIAAFFMATYWGFIYWEGELNDPVVFVFLVPCLFLALRAWGDRMTVRWAVVIGLIFGIYALMRPNILAFGPFAAAWMAWIAWRRGSIARIPASWAALLGVTLLTIAPVTVRNYVASGEFVPIATYFGENFLIGNGEDSDGVTPWTPYLQRLEGTGSWSVWDYDNVVKGLGKEVGKPDLTHSEASKIFTRQTLAYIGEHKWRTFKLALAKCVLFWSPKEITCNKVVEAEKAFYAPLK